MQKQRPASRFNNTEIRKSIDEVIALLKRQSRKVEGEIASMLDNCALWAKLAETWREVKRVAAQTLAHAI
ncbi:hypothetical protein [Bradyrhizobium glycinis]|uniref:hypothetical protein n=1 Tax=Bradyrhizobium glycinis TaxID=2751812 RepID=UPI0018D7C354|nr:hypothetical protein [Bradyrhizobium glycinis]MBH5373161.1 hypothetical protein [Bradyrhizobium glycinis]